MSAILNVDWSVTTMNGQILLHNDHLTENMTTIQGNIPLSYLSYHTTDSFSHYYKHWRHLASQLLTEGK